MGAVTIIKNENEVYPCLDTATSLLDVLAKSGLNEADRVRTVDIVRLLAAEPLIKSVKDLASYESSHTPHKRGNI